MQTLFVCTLHALRTAIVPARRLRIFAFTAIELIGVLAIISLISAAIFPQVIRRIDRAAWLRETADLSAMANGLVQTITKDKVITNNLPVAIAKYLDLSINQVTNTPRGFKRVFMVDPNLAINGAGLPYVQSNGGPSTSPTNARVLILSTIAQPGVTNISDSFSTIWDTPPGAKPASWTGKADDLCIQRVELSPLFHKLYLLNIDTNHNGFYAVEPDSCSGSSVVLSGGGQLSLYVIDGTAVNLYANGDCPPNGSLQLKVIMRQDESFVYQNNRWAHGLASDQLTLSLDPGSFGWWVNQFLQTPPNPGAKFGATQRAVIDEFYAFMWGYWSWSQSGFAGQSDNPKVQNPFFITVIDAQSEMATYISNLIQ